MKDLGLIYNTLILELIKIFEVHINHLNEKITEHIHLKKYFNSLLTRYSLLALSLLIMGTNPNTVKST